jgi:uncharacterized membrane protein
MKKSVFQSPWSDLYLVLLTNLLAIFFILIPPFNETFLRIPLALVLLLFLPGYMLIAAMFPGRDISGIERFTLSIGLSIAITVFDGFAISLTVWRFRPISIVVSLTLIILFFVIITYFMRKRLPLEQRFVPDPRPFIESLNTKEKMTDTEKALIIAMVGSIIIAGGMLIYANLTFEDEKFTTLYILGPDRKAEGYQTNLSFSEPATTIVGVENYEYAPVNYTLQVVLDGMVLAKEEIQLDHKEKWEGNITYIPDVMGQKMKLEFLLFKDGGTEIYRSVYLWVNSVFDPDDPGALESYLISVPQLINENMEGESGWIYSGNEFFSGKYSNYTYISKSHSYEIYLSDTEAGQYVRSGYSGAVYQDINATKKGLAVLTFNVKDSNNSNTEGNYLKQVLFNNKVVWEDDTAGNEGWQHVESLVRLSETNRVMLRVYAQKNLEHQNMRVWWDDIQLRTLTDVSIRDWNSNLTLGVPTNITVAVENYEPEYTEYNLEIRLDGNPVSNQNLWLAGREDWIEDISFIPEAIGQNIKLEAILYKEWDKKPYRNKEVRVSSSIDHDNPDTALGYVITPPEILNGDMEYLSVWYFNGVNFTGNYTDNTSHSPELSYEIKVKPDINTIAGDFGAINQHINDSNRGLVMLVFDVKDSITSNKPGYHQKQVLLNELVVWEDDIAGNEEWQHVEVPVILSRDNRLTVQVVELQGSAEGVQVWWDDIKFEPFSDKDPGVVYTPGYAAELRGGIFSIKAGKTVTISSGDHSDLYSTEKLTLFFEGDGVVRKGDAVYTTRTSSGNIWYKGVEYRSVDTSRADMLTSINIMKKSKTMRLNDIWVLGNGYNLTLINLDNHEDLAIMELSRNGLVIATEVLSPGEYFEYETKISNIDNFKILSFKIERILTDGVEINSLYFYSDSPIQVNIGDIYGEFEVDEITADRIIFKNRANIQFNNPTSLLNDRVMFRVAENRELAYQYVIKTKPGTYKIRGSSYNIRSGSWMNLSGGNFNSLSYDLDSGTSYETLNMYFSSDKNIKEGDATYTAILKGNQIGFSGQIYAPTDGDNLDMLSKILVNESEKSVRVQEPYLLKDGYIFTCIDITGEDIFVELTRNGVLVDSNIFSEGDTVIFKTIYNGDEITFFECKIEKLVGGAILLKDIGQFSETPVQLNVGDKFGDFKIIEITDSRIVIQNFNPIVINGEYIIFDNWIKFDVSGTTATPYTEVILQ